MRGDSILCLYYDCQFGFVEVGFSMIAKRALTGCSNRDTPSLVNSLRTLGDDERESHDIFQEAGN